MRLFQMMVFAIKVKGETMERMTHERVNGIKTGYWSAASKEEVVQRLAQYENTGLEPEVIKTLLKKMEEYVLIRKKIRAELEKGVIPADIIIGGYNNVERE